ncbi:MAG: flagellar motor switch phosphatase FliY [Bacillota bacterium]
MSSDRLSQAEIDALLRRYEEVNDEPQAELTEIEKDALGELGNISMGTAATTLSMLLNHKVDITTPRVSVTTFKQLQKEYPVPNVTVDVEYTEGLAGYNILVIQEQDAQIIADLMMGGNGLNPSPELSEFALSALSEAMNQMIGSSATSLSSMFGRKIEISPPTLSRLNFAADEAPDYIPLDDPLIQIAFRLVIPDLVDSKMMQLIPLDFGREMVQTLMGGMAPTITPEPVAAAPAPPPAPAPRAAAPTPKAEHVSRAPAAPPTRAMEVYDTPIDSRQSGYAAQSPMAPQPTVSVQPAQFPPLRSDPQGAPVGNLGLILDVPLQVTVELGRTRRLIREVLELAPGSVLELDKLSGEPVDILVNGKLIAKGEVVIIDENFGVRVTDIVSLAERVNTLQ